MSESFIYQEVEFVGDKQHHSHLREWFDKLPSNEVKGYITKVRCREFLPQSPDRFRLIILCRHPFGNYKQTLEKSIGLEDHDVVAIGDLISSFTSWIDSSMMQESTLFGGRQALIDWWPVEMLNYFLAELSPQKQAQMELNHHILDCLEMIRLATVPCDEFANLWRDSNDPFLAAGRIMYGEFQWIRKVPEKTVFNATECEAILERIGDYAREYLGLVRLALLTGVDSPLAERVSFVIRRFKIQHALEIPSWQALARGLLDDPENLPIHSAIVKPAEYNEIETACDRFRQDLVNATSGLEVEIPVLLNSFLPTLPAPKSAELFTGNLEN